jgi:hypothetical protein
MVKVLFSWMFVLAAPLWLAGGARHPLFISITEIEHNAKEQSVEVTCRIFTDDFENTLKKIYNTKVDLFADEHKNANTLIADYINKHLKITADGKALALKFVGYERQKEACWCYFEAAGVAAPKKIAVTNDLLHDYSEKQINMMNVTVNGDRKSYKLNYPEKTASFEF